MSELTTEAKQVRDFLLALFPLEGMSADDRVTLWCRQSKMSEHLAPADFDERRYQVIANVGRDYDVYVSCGLRRRGLSPSERGREEDVVAIPGAWIDIDIKSDAHKATDLPPSLEDAASLLEELPEPTLVVDSGHGLHAWWLFQHLLRIDSDQDRRTARSIVAGVQSCVRRKAQEKGWRIDSTADISRVLRIPGTQNCKVL